MTDRDESAGHGAEASAQHSNSRRGGRPSSSVLLRACVASCEFVLSSPALRLAALAVLFCATAAPGRRGEVDAGARGVHDPSAARCGRYVYVFSTGPGIPVRRSADMARWERVGPVFPGGVPASLLAPVPAAVSLWAPDISRTHGRYRLYYAASTFGSNRSAIGLATNATLDPADPAYRWRDEGVVIASDPGKDYNAIDPNYVESGDGGAWLAFGSFWSGIKLVQLDPATGKPRAGAPIRGIASRGRSGAIEAPYIVRHGSRYYLFVSFDLCCRGVESTYNIRVGRADAVTGPYVDREGRSMMAGGGTLLLDGIGHEAGPGHCAVLRDKSHDLLLYHYYDRDRGGLPALGIRTIRWDKEGWPELP